MQGLHISLLYKCRVRAPGVAALAALFASPYALAEDAPSADFISLMAMYVDADADRGAHEGRGFRMIYGHALAPKWYWETDVFGTVLETGDAVDTDFYQLGAATGVSWSWRDRNLDRWTPYFLGSLGFVYDDVLPDSDDDSAITLAAGVGAVSGSLFDNGIRLRGEARYLYDTFEENFGDIHYSLGIEIPLGKTKVVEKVVYIDRVVEVPVERVVEVQKRVEVPVERIVTVAEPDSDGDSIPDSRDKCPNTLAGVRVDASGCIIDAQTVTLNTVSFSSRSTELTPGSKKALDPVAASLISQDNLKVQIAGHTDSVGNADFNQTLSQERANAVMKYLVEKGVAADRLTAIGFGETQPVADNKTASGRAMNRRVEFRLVK